LFFAASILFEQHSGNTVKKKVINEHSVARLAKQKNEKRQKFWQESRDVG